MEDFFIYSTTTENHYLHFIGEDTDGNLIYELKEGIEGAALWKKYTAYAFITSVRRKEGFQNLKMVTVKKVLSNLNGPIA